MTKEKLAAIISAVLDPLIEAPVLLILLFLKNNSIHFWLLPIIMFLAIILPVLFIIFGLREGFISDWETTNRRERYGLNFFCLATTILSFFLVRFYGDAFLERLFLVFIVLILLYSLITFFWKISGHMTANTASVLLINLFFGYQFWWLFGLLPLVAWSRLVRKKHDIYQVLGGVILAAGVILLLI